MISADVIRKYEGLCRSIVARYFAPGMDRDDLLQEARIGLWKASRDFRPDAGSSFPSFAALCIERQVQTAIVTARRNKHRALNNASALDAPISNDGEGLTLADILPAPIRTDRESVPWAALRELLGPLERRVLDELASGLSQDALAKRLAVSPKSVDNALQRIRRKAASLASAEAA